MGYAETLTGARARKGEAQGVLSYQNLKGIFANPHIMFDHIMFGIYTPRFDRCQWECVWLHCHCAWWWFSSAFTYHWWSLHHGGHQCYYESLFGALSWKMVNHDIRWYGVFGILLYICDGSFGLILRHFKCICSTYLNWITLYERVCIPRGGEWKSAHMDGVHE